MSGVRAGAVCRLRRPDVVVNKLAVQQPGAAAMDGDLRKDGRLRSRRPSSWRPEVLAELASALRETHT
jgi:hypothetical protein